MGRCGWGEDRVECGLGLGGVWMGFLAGGVWNVCERVVGRMWMAVLTGMDADALWEGVGGVGVEIASNAGSVWAGLVMNLRAQRLGDRGWLENTSVGPGWIGEDWRS